VEVKADDSFIYVYRPEIVAPILDGDRLFYRPTGQGDWEAIQLVSHKGENGELLGYGSRAINLPGTVGVRIIGDEGLLYTFFASSMEEADIWGDQRAQDLRDYTGRSYFHQIGPNPHIPKN
jgi:hypothetical protein